MVRKRTPSVAALMVLAGGLLAPAPALAQATSPQAVVTPCSLRAAGTPQVGTNTPQAVVTPCDMPRPEVLPSIGNTPQAVITPCDMPRPEVLPSTGNTPPPAIVEAGSTQQTIAQTPRRPTRKPRRPR